jgi:hypothetical protein
MDQTQVVRMARLLLSILTYWMLTCWHTGALVMASGVCTPRNHHSSVTI